MARPPLTIAQLRAIQQRNIINADAMTLLREIKRLQGVVLATNELLAQWGDISEQALDRVEALQEQLEREPCVAEQTYDEREANADDITRKRNTFPSGPKYEPGMPPVKRDKG
jgi:hypothetical protein